jgi:hypothetical protein
MYIRHSTASYCEKLTFCIYCMYLQGRGKIASVTWIGKLTKSFQIKKEISLPLVVSVKKFTQISHICLNICFGIGFDSMIMQPGSDNCEQKHLLVSCETFLFHSPLLMFHTCRINGTRKHDDILYF